MQNLRGSLNPYFIGLPILIIALNSLNNKFGSLNPYFIGLPILIYIKIKESE